jgi:hypothetical protein
LSAVSWAKRTSRKDRTGASGLQNRREYHVKNQFALHGVSQDVAPQQLLDSVASSLEELVRLCEQLSGASARGHQTRAELAAAATLLRQLLALLQSTVQRESARYHGGPWTDETAQVALAALSPAAAVDFEM